MNLVSTRGQIRVSRRDSRRGVTMVELLIAVAIAGFIAAGIQSSIFIALHAIPNAQGSAQSTIRASKIVDQLVMELESATFVTEHTATTLGFTVPDRSGDGVSERIRYAWSGIPGGALTREYNGSAAVILAPQVNLFQLTPGFQSVSETYTGLAGEDATESLLVDASTGSSTSNKNVTSSSLLGQYFTLTLPANVYAWRPTRVQFLARRSSVPSETLVQMRPANVNLTPSNTVLEEHSLTNSMLNSSYSWISFDFSDLQPIASGDGICLVLKRNSGSTSVVVQDNRGSGELTGTIANLWFYSSTKSLNCQLYGKLTRSGQPKSFNSNYLTSMGIGLQINSTAPVLHTTGIALNHPELLSSKWELKFDQDPTSLDMNGDAINDWNQRGNNRFDTSQLVGNSWLTSGAIIESAPGNNFATTTVVDLRFHNKSVGGTGATFAINAMRSGNQIAPIWANLALQADGTQTLRVEKKINDSSFQTLIQIAGLPNQPVDLHLILDPVASAVCVQVNGIERGTFKVDRFLSTDSSRSVAIGANGSLAEFSYARIRVLEPSP